MFGEAIQWGEMGPGGFPAASLQGDSYAHKRGSYRRMTRQLRPRVTERMPYQLRGVSMNGIGAVSPDNQEAIDKILAQLDTTELQVDNEIGTVYSNLGAQGTDPDAEQALKQITARHEGVITDLIDLNIAITTMGDDEMPTFILRSKNAQQRMNQLLSELQSLRTGQYTSARVGGVLWGVGAMAAAGGTLWFLWRNRLRMQRRR